MKRLSIGRPSPAMVVALAALVFAMGGVAVGNLTESDEDRLFAKINQLKVGLEEQGSDVDRILRRLGSVEQNLAAEITAHDARIGRRVQDVQDVADAMFIRLGGVSNRLIGVDDFLRGKVGPRLVALCYGEEEIDRKVFWTRYQLHQAHGSGSLSPQLETLNTQGFYPSTYPHWQPCHRALHRGETP